DRDRGRAPRDPVDLGNAATHARHRRGARGGGRPRRALGRARTAAADAPRASPSRRAPLFSFLGPWKDPQGAGFQTVQALISMGSGGLFGTGLGQGVEKINYLPEAHTDMIVAGVGGGGGGG